MEVKVECDCGQRFAFEVEPVDGGMPLQVFCPSCGIEGTNRANAVIQKKLVLESTPPAAPSSEAPKLRLSRHAEMPVAAADAPPPRPTVDVPPDRAVLLKGDAGSAERLKKVPKVYREPDAKRGAIGAVIGAVIATAVWWVLWKSSGAAFGVMAIAVGWLAGFGARLMGRTEGQKMALMTAGIALTFIFGFQFVRASSEMSFLRVTDQRVEQVYRIEMEGARKVTAAVPNGTDDEIRNYLAKVETGETQTADLGEISAEEIKYFRTQEYAKSKALVAGERTKDSVRAELKKGEEEFASHPLVRTVFWVKTLGLFNIGAIIVGVASAYKFGYGEG
jgi:hypothetical protein